MILITERLKNIYKNIDTSRRVVLERRKEIKDSTVIIGDKRNADV